MIKKVIKENWKYLLAIILFILLVALTKPLGFYGKILNMDYRVILAINNIIDSRLTALFKFITLFGDWYLPIFIICITFLFLKNKSYSIILTINYLLGILLSVTTKLIISRPRPNYSIIPTPDNYSFPSGHTLTSIVFYGMLYYLISQTIKNEILKLTLFIFLTFLLILISFSRIYLGVHYFTDVLGGIILGSILVAQNINIVRKNYINELK
ncbi:MAG: phosphatase PAP2 family protein [Bacilli bacterium]|nr:phosphatase PAP2 family protein [Bacilli bacterium]